MTGCWVGGLSKTATHSLALFVGEDQRRECDAKKKGRTQSADTPTVECGLFNSGVVHRLIEVVFVWFARTR